MAKKKKEKNNSVLDAATIRGKSADELNSLLLSSKKELFGIRFKQTAGEQSPAHLSRAARKNIARIKTIQNEQKRGAANA